MKKALSLLISIAILLNITVGINLSVLALDSSGSCGENVTYTFDSTTGELTISGTGAMYNSEVQESPFCCNDLIKKVVINDGVTSICGLAFYDCTSLTSIEIPNSVTIIGYKAFGYCTNLTIIEIPNSVKSIGVDAFSECTSLTSIEIPNSVTSIGDWAFADCTSLTSIKIPNSVTSIGDCAFADCTSLTSIEIPNSVTSIGDHEFYDCTSLTSIEIPNSVTIIGCHAFEGCKSLTSIPIPNSVTIIGYKAFKYCTNLTDVYYTSTEEQWKAIIIEDSNEPLTNASIHCTDGVLNPRHVHSYNAVVTAPTCTTRGYTTRTCACGDEYVDTYVNAFGHKSDKGTVTKKATYTATGVKTYKCTVCKKVLKTETIAKLSKKTNTLVAKGKTATVKFANLKKKNQIIMQKNAFAISKAQGKVTYKKASGNKNITVNSAGKITVKKGLKKGTYKVAVNVTAAGNATYKAKTVKVTVVVKVK